MEDSGVVHIARRAFVAEARGITKIASPTAQPALLGDLLIGITSETPSSSLSPISIQVTLGPMNMGDHDAVTLEPKWTLTRTHS